MVVLAGSKDQRFLRANLQLNKISPEEVKIDGPWEELSLAPDGSDLVVLQSSGRVLRIPLTLNSAVDFARQELTREFTPGECKRLFPNSTCPTVLAPN
jgi:hypothetical protein